MRFNVNVLKSKNNKMKVLNHNLKASRLKEQGAFMTQEVFKKEIKKLGPSKRVILDLQGFVNPPNIIASFYNCMFWITYENDEQGNHTILFRSESEDETFQYLYDYITKNNLK